MRGHIVNRSKSDCYSLVLDIGKDPATGKRRQQWVSFKGTRKEAEKKLSELLHQLDTGIYVKPGKDSLADFMSRWLKEYCLPNLAPRTSEGYEFIIRRYLVPCLGQIALTELRPEHLQHFYAEKLSKGLSPRSVRYCHVTLHKALKTAATLGLIARNPADAVEPPRLQRHEIHTMNEDDIHRFLDAARSTPHYTLFFLALFTGMRRSELLALRWSDIDMIMCQLSVTRTIHHLRDGTTIFRPPKTEKGRRLVSLSPATMIVLREHREAQDRLNQSLGITPSEEDLLFSQYDGKPLLPDSITHAWMKLARRTGLNGVRLHDARHSHASLMLKQGVHPKIVQERLGHASIQITLDTYSHVAPGLQEAAAKRFDDIVIHKEGIKESVR